VKKQPKQIQRTMKLILVDDNPLFRSDLRFFIENRLKHTVIGEASDGLEFLKLPNLSEADIILMDLTMDNMNGFDATQRLLWDFPQFKVLAITMDIENAVLEKLIKTGFRGFVFKTDIFKALGSALERVNRGELIFDEDLKQKMINM
jgi:NarL family two-component system response regulator LiaR